MERRDIIMTFSLPPSPDDLESIAAAAVEALPEEMQELVDSLAIQIEEIPDEAVMQEMDLEDPFELVALFRSGKQIAPGVVSKIANDDDVIIIYRRPLLDLWCETGEDLNILMRQVIIEELGQNFDFSDDEIEEMAARPHHFSL